MKDTESANTDDALSQPHLELHDRPQRPLIGLWIGDALPVNLAQLRRVDASPLHKVKRIESSLAAESGGYVF